MEKDCRSQLSIRNEIARQRLVMKAMGKAMGKGSCRLRRNREYWCELNSYLHDS